MTTILLLVSDAMNLKVFAEVLESGGYFVERAGDIGDAIDRLEECTPDLLVIRHYTETLSGYDAAMHLRKMRPGLPVLIVGGVLDDVRLENRASLHGFELFPKPFKPAEFLDKVKEVLLEASSRNWPHRPSHSTQN